MKKATVLSLLPAVVTVTHEIIERSNIYRADNCIGANTLRAFLDLSRGENSIISWGREDGVVLVEQEDDEFMSPVRVAALSEDGSMLVDMMTITTPMKVQLAVYDEIAHPNLPIFEQTLLED